MKNIFTIILALAIWNSMEAQNESHFLSWDLIAVDGIEGMTTNRLYLNTTASDDFLTSVSGWAGFESMVQTTTSFYQNENGWVSPNSNVPELFDIFEGLEYDSWITIGIDVAPVGANLEMGIGTFPPSADVWVLPFEEGGDLLMDADGAWYITLGSSNGISGDDLQILLGQFTTDGTITGSLNCQIFSNGIPADSLADDLYTLEIPERSADAVGVGEQLSAASLHDWSLELRADFAGRCELFGWPSGPWLAEAWSADGRLISTRSGHGRGGQLALNEQSGVVLIRVVAGGQARVARLVKGW